MIAAGPGFLGYGASLLWTGPHASKPALYDLRVAPGDAVIRRHADQLVLPACGLPASSCMPTFRAPPNGKRSRCSSRRPAVSQAAISFCLPDCPRTSSTTSPPGR
ncbi:hypothetical protein SBA3_3380013 [Candidatus Sulfopaludibacter sp. SbA3]|nr:hypothetical protein SBA3_3380013 [Candidatus Sulfopaludibacter sp. SbA3]